MSKVNCKCGAVYNRTGYDTPYRDQDKFNCVDCGHEIESWSGGHTLEFELIRHAPKKATK